MACQLPVVALDIPSVRDLLRDGEASGGLIIRGEEAETFAAHLGRLLDDKTLSLQMGKKARLSVERRFSPEIIGAQLRDFIFPAKEDAIMLRDTGKSRNFAALKGRG